MFLRADSSQEDATNGISSSCNAFFVKSERFHRPLNPDMVCEPSLLSVFTFTSKEFFDTEKMSIS